MDVNEVKKLLDIVDSKNWAAFDGLLASGKTVQDTLQVFLSGMNAEQRKLSLSLLERYLIMKDYQLPAKGLLEKIVASTDDERIFISTIKDFSSQKVKSGASLSYEFSSLINGFPQKRFSFFEDPSSKEFVNAEGFCVLVDDFIGSGNQFVDMLAHLKDIGVVVRCDCVAALVIQEEGLLRIQGEGYRTIYLKNRPKCLQELASMNSTSLDEVYRIYDTIEIMTCCNDDFKRGYSASEASVTMKKTPNNTLPIFWHEGSKKWPAPFPRPRS